MQQHKEVIIKQLEFQNAFHDYFETEKNTNGITAQAKNLYLQWHHDPPQILPTTTSSNTIPSSVTFFSDLPVGQSFTEERCRLQGKLRIANEYICITLEALVLWQFWSSPRNEGSDGIQEKDCHLSNQPDYYSLHFKLSASGEFINTEDNAPVQISKRIIISKMKKRLEEDPFIRKLLGYSRTNEQNLVGMSVCEALIQHKWPSNGSNGFSFDSLSQSVEERVDVSDEALEGIRRAVLSLTECNLSIMESLISLPWLATSTTSCGYRYRDRSKKERSCWDRYMSVKAMDVFRTACDRVALRLLEDALFDACEREGEEDIIEDLNLNDVEGKVWNDGSQATDDVKIISIVHDCDSIEPRRTRTDYLHSKRSKHN